MEKFQLNSCCHHHFNNGICTFLFSLRMCWKWTSPSESRKLAPTLCPRCLLALDACTARRCDAAPARRQSAQTASATTSPVAWKSCVSASLPEQGSFWRTIFERNRSVIINLSDCQFVEINWGSEAAKPDWAIILRPMGNRLSDYSYSETELNENKLFATFWRRSRSSSDRRDTLFPGFKFGYVFFLFWASNLEKSLWFGAENVIHSGM